MQGSVQAAEIGRRLSAVMPAIEAFIATKKPLIGRIRRGVNRDGIEANAFDNDWRDWFDRQFNDFHNSDNDN